MSFYFAVKHKGFFFMYFFLMPSTFLCEHTLAFYFCLWPTLYLPVKSVELFILCLSTCASSFVQLSASFSLTFHLIGKPDGDITFTLKLNFGFFAITIFLNWFMLCCYFCSLSVMIYFSSLIVLCQHVLY